MSRIGKKPIKLDKGVVVTTVGQTVTVAGPKGKLDFDLPGGVTLTQADAVLQLGADVSTSAGRMSLGLARSLLQGMVIGVTAGYRKDLSIEGVGFRGNVQGQKITLSLGYSHPVVYEAPAGVKVTMPDQTKIVVEGISKHLVGETAATLRRFHAPDAYKGKGVRYTGEQITLKEGKTVG